MKILVTPRSFGKEDAEAFAILERAGLEVAVNDTGGILSREALAERIAGCDGVILGVDPLDAWVLDHAPRLRAVAKYGVGVDNIDLDACSARGIAVSRTVGANAGAVADYAFALMLAVARRVARIDALCRHGDWSKVTGLDVNGKTLGLLGLGAIGRGMVARASGFGMTILAHDPFWDADYAATAGITRAEPEEIYARADFISPHLPLTDATRNLIGERELAQMKKTAILVNTARGGIVDENALLNALKNRTIYGAGIDAFEHEPPENPEWYGLDNVVLGSHSAASSDGAVVQMSRMAATNLVRDLGLDS
ncbi:MAG: phosphoglycerate dehydrogenase [Planctomycetaceae bacterium]|nr:phosphoglycerate dehydrogenase [Planctomycetaceae bacterium]